jgi:IS4 transposase
LKNFHGVLRSYELIGNSETGAVFEHRVQISSTRGTTYEARRIMVRLNQSTRKGETELAIFTNLPKDVVDALKVAELYRQRWEIETAFQKLEKYFYSEINTLETVRKLNILRSR